MDRAVRAIIEAKYDKCVARVVHRLQRVPAKDWDRDNSVMRTLWDHWKREMQEQHSVFHGLIEQMVEGIIWQVVNCVSQEDGMLLTLGTDALDDLEVEPIEPIFDRQAVAAKLMQRVNSRADDEPHRREVQRVLDDQARDRFERDTEGWKPSH